jgi:DNA-binding LacI/PurR family transcriptional regulator
MAVPHDVSIVGFDDIDLARHVEPALTTVHQPIRRKGEEAVDLLLATIRGGGAGATEHRRLDARLVVRHSSGPVTEGRA